ncbi:GTPase [Baaleninema simplex]|uniref:GTPase n=1 Tax=Baaleninema simplex TaxID=2862350 RepID=UPI000346329B|nr:GTPase [Baaleninema simplex]
MIEKINFTKIHDEFDRALEMFDNILEKSDRDEAEEYRHKLKRESEAIRENPLLKVAFIGQYSSGKSTIISALTGNRNIKIGADITTDKATPYDWNGIKIVDTPGIGTERKDHDEVTYREIEQSDLLVFCTTHMLLDKCIVEHFTKLAYEKRYSHKMMLVFNKLSSEAGDDDVKIANYRASMTQALSPHSLDDFPVCFFDAKDYCEGVDEDEEDLIELSRFTEFIQALDRFVRERDKLAQLDTPIRRVLGYVDEVEIWFSEGTVQDKNFLETLNRLAKTVHQKRNEFRIKLKKVILDATSEIRTIGNQLANDLTEFKNEQEFKDRQKEIERKIEEIWDQTEKVFQELIESAIESLQEEVKQVLNSDLVQSFIAMLNAESEFKAQYVEEGFNFNDLSQQVKFFEDIAGQVGLEIVQNATRQAFKLSGGGGAALRSIDVVGSNLHKGVLAVGKFVGFKFRPWQAVGIAKNIGNVARFAGPALVIVGAGFEAWELAEQQKKAKQLRQAQGGIDREFAGIARKVEQQLKEQQQTFEDETYDYIEMQIQSNRTQFQNRQVSNSQQAQKLAEVRKKLEHLLLSLKT